jgi:hemoglobin-like flavoprotein
MATDSAAAPSRQKLFISYAREDTAWLERFLPYFKPAERGGTVEIWWDRKIPSGGDWGPILEREITDASAALVLVSVNLLNSNFILSTELPAIHAQRKSRNLHLYGTLLKLRHCAWRAAAGPGVRLHRCPTLAHYLAKKGKPFPPSEVTRLIQRRALAIQEYQRHGLRYGLLASHHVFYDEHAAQEPMPRLQAIAISSHLSQSDEMPSHCPYQEFFARCPEAAPMFANLKMEDQYAKLDAALHYLLNFADMDMTEPTALTHIARHHARLRVTGKQFNDFAEALLETLRHFGEAEAVEAWERTIRPGVQYLKLRSAPTPK